MERKKEKKIWWIKTGGGSLYLKVPEGSNRKRGQKIKSNEKFQAYPSDIPKAFRDTVKPLEGMPPDPTEAPITPKKEKYVLEPLPGGWYNILNSEGKKMNETSMRKSAADAMVEDLIK